MKTYVVTLPHGNLFGTAETFASELIARKFGFIYGSFGECFKIELDDSGDTDYRIRELSVLVAQFKASLGAFPGSPGELLVLNGNILDAYAIVPTFRPEGIASKAVNSVKELLETVETFLPEDTRYTSVKDAKMRARMILSKVGVR